MNDIVDDGKKDETAPGANEVQAQSADSTSEKEGGLTRKQSEGEQFPEVFWADAVSTTLHQTHPRVPQLKTEVQCQYKFENSRIYVRTLRYKMTTRYGPWYRANLDIGLRFGDYVRHNSEDNLRQDEEWHDYQVHLDSSLAAPDFDSYLVIRVDYDGRNNDVEPHEGWGVRIRPAQTPIIESPVSDTAVTMPFTVSGKNGLLNGNIRLIAVAANNPIIGYQAVQSDGRWSASVTLPGGALSFYAEQIIGYEISRRSNTVTVRLALPPPSFTAPANGSYFKTGSTVLLKGRGAVGKTIDVMTPGGGILHGTTVVKVNGEWEVTFNSSNYPDGGIVKMHVGHRDMNDWSAERLFTLVARPTIALPASDAVTDPRGPISGGNAISGATVEVLKDLEHAFKIGQGTAGESGQWSVTSFTQDIPPGAFSIVAQQRVSGVISDVSVARFFKVRPPALTSVRVTLPTITTAGFSGSGYPGATVEITIIKGPAGATVPPAALVAGGSWTTTSQNFPIGQYDLKFVQKVSDNADGWIPSLEYRFGILTKLPPPSQVAYSVSNFTPSFSGQGNVGVEVHILESNSPVAPPVQVTTAGWLTTASSPWVPGSTRTVRVVQRLGDAESEAVELVVNIEAVPVPFNVKYTVQNYTPTFSGEGANGAILGIYVDEGITPAAPATEVRNGLWSSSAFSSWGPVYRRIVYIRQSLNDVWSQWVTIAVDIPPEAPVISPIEGDGQPLVFKGTCLVNAALSLKFSDSATEHKPDGRTGNWTFQRSTDFALDKEHTATLIQTIAQQDSLPALREFSVYPNKLIITEPAENAEVARDIVVSGNNGEKGALLQLYDAQFEQPLGVEKALTADGRWEVALENLEFRKYQINARQKILGKESRPSDERNFFVVLKPPLIDVPQQDQPLPRTFTISGIGMPFGQVAIWSQGEPAPLLEKIPVNSSGEWKAELTMSVGSYIFKARQFFQTHESKDSPLRSFKVVPAAPIIESPGKGSHVGQSFVASGFGVFGDLITLALNGSKRVVLGSTPVLEDRSWSLTLTLDAPPGICNLVAIASCDGFESSESAVHPVVQGTYLPGFGKPAIGQWVQSPISFAGKGRPGVGRITNWYDPDVLLSTNIPVTPQGWQSAAGQPLRDGGHWCRFQQTIVDDADGATLSDWIESGRFEKSSTPPD
jgi:hypothetical protein